MNEMGCSVEVLVLYVKEIEEVVINIPSELIAQFERTLGSNTYGNEVVTYLAAKEYTKHMQPNQIREALMKGYVEML